MMEWKKYSELKGTLSLGDVLVATFKDPESINRVTCTCCVDTDNVGLINMRGGNKIDMEPDYAFLLEKPDQFIMRYFV